MLFFTFMSELWGFLKDSHSQLWKFNMITFSKVTRLFPQYFLSFQAKMLRNAEKKKHLRVKKILKDIEISWFVRGEKDCKGTRRLLYIHFLSLCSRWRKRMLSCSKTKPIRRRKMLWRWLWSFSRGGSLIFCQGFACVFFSHLALIYIYIFFCLAQWDHLEERLLAFSAPVFRRENPCFSSRSLRRRITGKAQVPAPVPWEGELNA